MSQVVNERAGAVAPPTRYLGQGYVDAISTVTRIVGQFAMYLIFAMTGILFFETVSRTIFNHPWIWTVEMAQFVMSAYYTLGGAWALQLKGHVRMDLAYARWSPKNKALADALTFTVVIFYMIMMLVGGWISLDYSLRYSQKSYSSWAPIVSPIKIIMMIGMVLMTLQVIAELCKDLAILTGRDPGGTLSAGKEKE